MRASIASVVRLASTMPRSAASLVRRVAASRRGNVMMIMGFAMVPMTFATGMVIDYSRAARTQTKLNAITDAAALAGVTPALLAQTRTQSALAAANFWYAQAGVAQCSGATVNRVIYNSCAMPGVGQSDDGQTYKGYDGTLRVTVTDTTIATSLSRVVTVTYAAKSGNIFGNVLGSKSIQIGGTSATNAKTAPNIDFYVMLDVSSSMALPISSAGIAQMKTMTGGCAFACHQSNPDNTDNIRQYSNGTLIDFYTAAHNAGIILRVDNGKTAIQDTIDRAGLAMASNNAKYRFAVATFARGSDYTQLIGINSSLANSRAKAGTAQTVIVEKGGMNWDRQTEHSDAIVKAGLNMPLISGTGSNQLLDTPQSILVIVTDGMRDEERFGRQMGPIPPDQCTLIKARPNTRIAILYTTYDPASIAGDDWSQQNVAWRLPSVAPALQACASPNLFFEVSTDQSISAAMGQLFDTVTATARITQ